MFKPKVRIIKQDDKVQVFELTGTDPKNDLKAVIYHYHHGVGEKLDLANEAVIREVWKEQVRRRAEVSGEVLVEEPESPPEQEAPKLVEAPKPEPVRAVPRPLGFEKK